MMLDWFDSAVALALIFAAAALAGLTWTIRARSKDRKIDVLAADLAAVRTDPQAAMAEFLKGGAAALKFQADDLHSRTVSVELEIARKRKRLSVLEKRPDRKEGEVAFQQEALAVLNRRLIEYQTAARRTQTQLARNILFRQRLFRGELNAALAPRFIEEADRNISAAKVAAHGRLRDIVLDPEAKAASEQRARPEMLAAWRAKSARDRREGPRVKHALAK